LGLETHRPDQGKTQASGFTTPSFRSKQSNSQVMDLVRSFVVGSANITSSKELRAGTMVDFAAKQRLFNGAGSWQRLSSPLEC
jgi:hypothetical protein